MTKAWSWLSTAGRLSAVLSALVLGSLLGLYAPDLIDSAYDGLRPVSVARAVEIHRDGEEIHFRLLVTRKRAECRVIGSYAYAIMVDGRAVRANSERTDARPVGDVPLGIEVDVGEWKVWPVTGAVRVVLYAHHNCEGKPTATRLVEVTL